MERKSHIDTFGAVALVLFAVNLGFNQVVIKVSTGGFNPVFLAGLRSLGAVFLLLGWTRLRGGSRGRRGATQVCWWAAADGYKSPTTRC